MTENKFELKTKCFNCEKVHNMDDCNTVYDNEYALIVNKCPGCGGNCDDDFDAVYDWM